MSFAQNAYLDQVGLGLVINMVPGYTPPTLFTITVSPSDGGSSVVYYVAGGQAVDKIFINDVDMYNRVSANGINVLRIFDGDTSSDSYNSLETSADFLSRPVVVDAVANSDNSSANISASDASLLAGSILIATLDAKYLVDSSGVLSSSATQVGATGGPYELNGLTLPVTASIQLRYGLANNNKVDIVSPKTIAAYSPPSATVPDAPTDVEVTPGDQSILATWNAPANDGGSAITGYNVYVGNMDSGDPVVIIPTQSTATSYTISNLTNGTNYLVSVSAINAEGEGTQSFPAPASPVAPISPSLIVTAEASGFHSIAVSWNYSDPQSVNAPLTLVGLELRGPDNSYASHNGENGANTGSYTFSNLPYGAYTVSAIAFDGADNTLASAPANPENPITVTLVSPLTLSSTSENNTFSPSWTFNDGMGNTAPYWFKVEAGGSTYSLASGDQFPKAFSAGEVSFTVKVYSDDQYAVEFASGSATATVVNGAVNVLFAAAPTANNYELELTATILFDSSFEGYLTLGGTYSASFNDGSIFNNVAVGTSVQTMLNAGQVEGTFTLYDSQGNQLDSPQVVSNIIVPGLKLKTLTNTPGQLTAQWDYRELSGAVAFASVKITLAVTGGGTYEYTDDGSAGEVIFKPAAPLGMRAALVSGSSDIASADLGKPFVISAVAQSSSNDPIVFSNPAAPSASGIVPNYVASLTASARGGIKCAIVAWNYSDPGSVKPAVASYTVQFNSVDTGATLCSFDSISPDKFNNLFNDEVLVPNSYNVVVTAVFGSGDPLVSSSQPIIVSDVPSGFGVVTAEKDMGGITFGSRKSIRGVAASNTVSVSWHDLPVLGSALSDSYDVTQNIIVTLNPDDPGSDVSSSVANNLKSASVSNVPDGSYAVTVSQNLVGAPFGGLTFSDKLIQTNMPGKIVLGAGAGGGGGGAAALNFERPHAASVSQEVDITLIGTTVPMETADETLQINVPASALNAAFDVTAADGWDITDLTAPVDGHQSYPRVVFTPGSLLSAASAAGSTVVSDFEALNSTNKVDDKAVPYATLQDYMSRISNSNYKDKDGNDRNLLSEIPIELVRSVQNVALTIAAGQSISDLFAPQDDAAVTADTTVPADAWALQLFEQAAGAGKVSKGADQSTVLLNFVADDSISLFVDYTLSKTRKYLLEGYTTAAKFNIAGVEIDTTSGTGNNEEHATDNKRVEFKFTAV
jgi:Fibronectin type III domain